MVRFIGTSCPLGLTCRHDQVFTFSGGIRIHKLGNVACRPVYGALSKSISYDFRHDIPDFCRKHRFCEYCQFLLI
jgi:hypothetical protein